MSINMVNKQGRQRTLRKAAMNQEKNQPSTVIRNQVNRVLQDESQIHTVKSCCQTKLDKDRYQAIGFSNTDIITDHDRSHFVEWGKLKPNVLGEQQNEVVVEVGCGEIQHGSLLVRMSHQKENRGIQRRGREKSLGRCLKNLIHWWGFHL